MPDDKRNLDEAWKLFYGDGMPLGEIAKKLGCGIYDLSPWLMAPAIRSGLDGAEKWMARFESASADLTASRAEIERLNGLINTPTTDDWMRGVQFEAAHQIERWGSDHDAGKSPFDWFWLIGYLAQKAAASAVAGDADKAKHHTVSTGAALLNWHRALAGENTEMRPGIDAQERGLA